MQSSRAGLQSSGQMTRYKSVRYEMHLVGEPKSPNFILFDFEIEASKETICDIEIRIDYISETVPRISFFAPYLLQ